MQHRNHELLESAQNRIDYVAEWPSSTNRMLSRTSVPGFDIYGYLFMFVWYISRWLYQSYCIVLQKLIDRTLKNHIFVGRYYSWSVSKYGILAVGRWRVGLLCHLFGWHLWLSCSLRLQIYDFLCTVHICVKSRQWPVHEMCPHVTWRKHTYHNHCWRNWPFYVVFTAFVYVMAATPPLKYITVSCGKLINGGVLSNRVSIFCKNVRWRFPSSFSAKP